MSEDWGCLGKSNIFLQEHKVRTHLLNGLPLQDALNGAKDLVLGNDLQRQMDTVRKCQS